MLAVCAQSAPGAKPGPPQPPPAGRTLSPTAPPIAVLSSPVVIKLDNGVVVTVTTTNKITRAELRRWLREAALRTP